MPASVKPLFSNATIWYDARDLAERDALVSLCAQIVHDSWTGINAAVRGRRIETPILTNRQALAGHVEAGFPMLDTKRGLLRPETTAGSAAVIHEMYPQTTQLLKTLPIYLWQFGKSFRDETNPDTMRASRLRLVEFHQLEFHLFARHGTMAPYLDTALSALAERFGGEAKEADELPHYSRRTIDWEMDGLEVAGCSERTDWEHGLIFEVSIGIDRLLAQLGRVRPD